MIEIDVQRCASGELVVFHDRLLDRLTGEHGAVAGTTWERLRGLPLGASDATIPRFERFLEPLPPSVDLNVELKHTGLDTDLHQRIGDLERDVLVSSFVPQALFPLADASVRTAVLIGPEGSADWEAELAAAESIGATAVHPHHELVDADRVRMAHDRGLTVNTWTVRERETVERMRAAGVDGVIVDDWRLVESR